MELSLLTNSKCLMYNAGNIRDVTSYNLQNDSTHHGFGFRGLSFNPEYIVARVYKEGGRVAYILRVTSVRRVHDL